LQRTHGLLSVGTHLARMRADVHEDARIYTDTQA